MHRALAIPEIVRTILDCFSPKPEHHRIANKDYYLTATALRSSVVNVALVCRSFSEPALDILWWAMDDLTPLFNLLPGFQNEQEVCGISSHIHTKSNLIFPNRSISRFLPMPLRFSTDLQVESASIVLEIRPLTGLASTHMSKFCKL